MPCPRSLLPILGCLSAAALILCPAVAAPSAHSDRRSALAHAADVFAYAELDIETLQARMAGGRLDSRTLTHARIQYGGRHALYLESLRHGLRRLRA